MSTVKLPDTENIEAGSHTDKHVSCRVINSLFKYLESQGYETHSLVYGLPFSKEYLCDSFNWVSYSIREKLQDRAAKLTNDDKIMYKVGLATPKLSSISGIEYMIRLVGSPKLAYRSVPKYSSLFDKISKFEVDTTDDCKAIVTMSLHEGYPFSKSACYYAQGILSAIPTLWDLPPANVFEKQCMCKTYAGHYTEITERSNEKCVFEVTWQPLPNLYSRLSDKVLKKDNNVTNAIKKLEENYRLLDEKNTELTRRNAQLSKVREIALGVQSVGTVDAVLSHVVELAREIPGVRFVLVLKIDEITGTVTTPYFSKIRNESVIKSLRAIGFDPIKQLGVNSNDKKLSFRLDQLKIAQDYVANPRTIVKDRLYDALNGVWPKLLCDSIESLLTVKRFVLVPIMVDGCSWGSMFFFLDDDVPNDILEMGVAHCATAIKSALSLESLERRNRELSSINTITSKVLTSLDLKQILDTCVIEANKVFGADAIAIYLMNENGSHLNLKSYCGLRENIAEQHMSIESGSGIIDRFIKSDDNLLIGDLADYSTEFPHYRSMVSKGTPLPFATAIITSAGKRFGLITISRIGKGKFTDIEQSILLSIANQVSVVIENARLHTEVTKSEEKLRLIIEAVAEGITVTNLETVITQVNEATVKMHGYQCKDEMIGISALDLIAKHDHSMAIENTKRTLETEHSGMLEYTFVRKDGSEFPAELIASLIKDPSGIPIGFVACTRDISERKQAEQLLRESERKYRLITDSTTDYIAMLSFSGKYTYVSPSHKKLGYDPEEMLGKSGFDFIHADDRKRLISTLVKYTGLKIKDLMGLKQKNFTQNISFRFRDVDSNWHYIEATANLTDAISGQGLNILLICRDMTERKQIDDGIRESEEKHRMIFDSANDIILLLDKKGKIVDINKKVEEIGRYTREELIGKNFISLTKIMTKKSIATVAKHFSRRMLGFTIPTYEVEMYKGSGELATMEINAVAVRKKDKIVGSLATLRDISERKIAESALRHHKDLIDQILSTMTSAVFVVDNDGKIVLTNRSFCERFGYKNKDIENQQMDQILPVKQLQQAISSVIKGNQKQSQLEFRYTPKDSPKIYVANIFTFQTDRSLVVLHDITEERERQDKIHLTDRLASVGEMASGIAHELNNPLTSVIGLANLLKEEDVPDEVREDIDSIYREAQRASTIVKNLLTFARKHSPSRIRTQINQTIEEVLQLRAYEHNVHNIHVDKKLDVDLPEIMADYFQLQQVFLNIILNAEWSMIKAHNQGTLIINTERVNGNIKISFSDDGPGIAKDNIGKLFDPFFTTKDVGQGTGLGLSICYGIVNTHGGRIYAQSEPNSGATFVVELPINNKESKESE